MTIAPQARYDEALRGLAACTTAAEIVALYRSVELFDDAQPDHAPVIAPSLARVIEDRSENGIFADAFWTLAG